MKTIRAALLLVILVLAAAAFYIQSGRYDVSAISPSHGLLDKVAERVSDRSVEYHAAGIAPPPLGDPAQVRLGYAHYEEMCVSCHGAPGVKMSEIGAGLNPGPPDLIEAAKEKSPAELYWVIKNGIKMTGMPAFGPTHGEKELWAIVSFVQKLPTLSPEQYKNMVPAHAAGEAR